MSALADEPEVISQERAAAIESGRDGHDGRWVAQTWFDADELPEAEEL